jgi:predicted RNA-binding Zn ribbon-like protein
MLNESEPAKRAPEPLRLVQQFVNSVEYEGGVVDQDDLGDARALRGWLRKRDLIAADAKVSDADLARAIDVREGLRALLFANNGHAVAPESLERLERAAGRANLRASFAPDRDPRLEADCSGVDGGLARLLAIVATASADGTWPRLKACADEGCRWAFFDHSKNRSGRWCSMETCGNRQKARSLRARTSGQTSGGQSVDTKSPRGGKARS